MSVIAVAITLVSLLVVALSGLAAMADNDIIPAWARNAVILAAYVALWYIVSIGLTLLNKYIFSYFDDGNFGFPLCMTCLHMILQFCTARVLFVAKTSGPGLCRSHPNEVRRLESTQTALSRRRNFVTLMVPVGVVTAMDIALSNWAMVRVTVSVYTIAKSSAVVFNLLFSVAMGLQLCRADKVAVILLIFAGVALTSYQGEAPATEAVSHTAGVMAAVAAAACAALRWVLVERVMWEARHFVDENGALRVDPGVVAHATGAAEENQDASASDMDMDAQSHASDDERMRLIPPERGSQHADDPQSHLAPVADGLAESPTNDRELDRRFWSRPPQQWPGEGLEAAIHSEALGVYAEESGWLSDQEEDSTAPRGGPGLDVTQSVVSHSEHQPLARRDSESVPLKSSSSRASRGVGSLQRYRSGSATQVRVSDEDDDEMETEGTGGRNGTSAPAPLSSSSSSPASPSHVPPPPAPTPAAHRHVVDPVVLLSLVAPISALTLIFPSIAFELSGFLSSSVWADSAQLGVLLAAVAGGGAVAFLLIFAEVQVVSRTSALTTTVIGHAKESVVIVLSVIIYGDSLSWLNLFGVVLAFVGTGMYSYTKHKEKVERERAQMLEGRRGRAVSQSAQASLKRERNMDVEPGSV